MSISDTGGGIPEAIRKRIFEPFFTTKEVGKGTGQGLSIAHNVIKAHGGTLKFVTEIGKGTTFTCACRSSTTQAKLPSPEIQVMREKPPPVPLPDWPPPE